MESKYNLDFYKLKRQTKLYQGQTILKTNASVPSGFVEAQIFFDPSSDNTAIVKADQFTLSDEIAGTLTIPDAYIDNFPDTYFPETGIPCVDQNGYIRGLLIEEEGKDVTFKLVSGNLQENAGLSISEISGFKQDLIGKITYNETDMLLDGEAEINDDICDTNDDDGACVLTNEHEADSHTLLGFSGNYDNLKNFFHYELFFLDNNLVDDLFAGRYIYNRYKIKNLTGIYKKTYDDTAETLFFPTQMQWTAEAEHGYTKIVLKKMRVYYRPEDCEKKVVDAEGNVSWEIAEGAKNAVGLLRVKNTACHARLYNTEFAFAQMEGETRNPLNEIPNDKFKRYVELLNGENTIADKEFLFEYLDGNYLGLKFEQSDIDLSSFTFWISNDDLSNKFTPSEDNLYASKEIPEKILNIYLQNPGKPKMEKVTATDITDVNAIPELMESDFQKYELDDKTYWGFQHNSQTYYLSDADKVNQVDVNMLNFSQPENNPFFVKDTDTHDDIYCDDEKIKELCGEQFDYKHDFLISSMLRNKLSKYACNFPMEWNADLYKLCKEDADCGRCPVRMLRNECTCFPKQLDDKGFDVRYAPRIARMKQKADVWNEVAELKDSGKKSIWHFHPVYFAEHMKQFNTSFNPYENYSYNFTVGSAQDANSPREPKSDTAKSNPGFAPRVDKGNYEDGPVHNGEYYPECTSPYGIGRFGSEWRHSGIDLGTKGKSQPIKSFIYGEVWACIEDVVQFGNVMIIKNLNEPKVYFLAHLADDGFIKKENERFKPGDTVAMAGGTGGTGTDGKKITYEIHLHLEVFLMTAGAEEKREALNDSYKTSKNRTIFLKDTLVAKRVDPFNHSPDTFITDWQWRE
jgi:hypothetical protein